MSAPTVKDHLIHSLRRAGKYNRFEQIQPAAILWPDKNRHWEPVIPCCRVTCQSFLFTSPGAPLRTD